MVLASFILVIPFVFHIVATVLRLISAASKQVLLIELKVSWVDHFEEANEQKRSKYRELVEAGQAGWHAVNPSNLGLQMAVA